MSDLMLHANPELKTMEDTSTSHNVFKENDYRLVSKTD